ncbi:MAG: Hpt domain-containing protein [Polyangiaceae bacterium]|jgi:HPt (histidine-containing phosphotransfer) domain-containing protein
MNADAVREALRELAREMAALLPERADAIAKAFERARANPESGEAREGLRVLAHRMRGSAGSHGFAELSRDAGVIEDEILAAGSILTAEVWALLAARVAQICAEASRAAREASAEGAP